MSEDKRYKVTISCTTILPAENEEKAKKFALYMFETGPRLYTSVDCEPVEEDGIKEEPLD